MDIMECVCARLEMGLFSESKKIKPRQFSSLKEWQAEAVRVQKEWHHSLMQMQDSSAQFPMLRS
jgi:hypothetical protein